MLPCFSPKDRFFSPLSLSPFPRERDLSLDSLLRSYILYLVRSSGRRGLIRYILVSAFNFLHQRSISLEIRRRFISLVFKSENKRRFLKIPSNSIENWPWSRNNGLTKESIRIRDRARKQHTGIRALLATLTQGLPFPIRSDHSSKANLRWWIPAVTNSYIIPPSREPTFDQRNYLRLSILYYLIRSPIFLKIRGNNLIRL